MKYKYLRALCSLLLAMVVFTQYSFAKSSFVETEADSDSSINLKIHSKDLSLDLSKDSKIRMSLSPSSLYKTDDPSSSFRMDIYEFDGDGELVFLRSQTNKLRKNKLNKKYKFKVELDNFDREYKTYQFKVYDTSGNLASTNSYDFHGANIPAPETPAQQIANSNCGDGFGECQLDYFFDNVIFESRTSKPVDVAKLASGKYKVSMPGNKLVRGKSQPGNPSNGNPNPGDDSGDGDVTPDPGGSGGSGGSEITGDLLPSMSTGLGKNRKAEFLSNNSNASESEESTNSGLNLGSPDQRWQDLYISPHSLHIGTVAGEEGVMSLEVDGDDDDVEAQSTSPVTFHFDHPVKLRGWLWARSIGPRRDNKYFLGVPPNTHPHPWFNSDGRGWKNIFTHAITIGKGVDAGEINYDTANDRFTFNRDAKINGKLIIMDGTQGADKVLVSDENGETRWEDLIVDAANRQLNNLTSPTEINQDLNPDSSGARSLGSDTSRWNKFWGNDLDITGLARIGGGNPQTGYVLTAIDNQGNAEWRQATGGGPGGGPLNLGGELSGTTDNAVLDNDSVISKTLTGYNPGAGIVDSNDSLLSALQKLDGNIAANVLDISSNTSDVSANTAAIAQNTSDIASANQLIADVTAGTTPIVLAGDVSGPSNNTSLDSSAVLGVNLAGLNSAPGALSAGDSILSAMGKLDGNAAQNSAAISLNSSSIAANTTGVLANTSGLADLVSGAQSIPVGGEVSGDSSNMTLDNAAVIGSELTGFNPSPGSIDANDTLLSAMQKLDANMTANDADIAANVAGILANTSAIASKADSSAVTALDTRVTQNESDIAALQAGGGSGFDPSSSDSLIPKDANQTLGDSSNPWKDLYLSGNSIFIGGQVIQVVSGQVTMDTGLTLTSGNLVVPNGSTIDGVDISDLATTAVDVSSLQSGLSTAQSDIASNTAALGSIGSTATGNASAIASNDADIAANASAIAGNTSGIASNTSNIVANDGDISTLTDNLNSLVTSVGDLGTDLSGLTGSIAGLSAGITSNSSNIVSNTSNIVANDGDIADLDLRLLALETVTSPPVVDLGNIGESLDFDADDAYDIGTATSRVRDVYVSGDIEIAGFINGVDVSSLSNVVSNVSTLQSELDTAEAGLATAQADVTSLQSGLVTAQSDISLNSAGVLNNLQGVQTNSAGVSGNASGIASNTSNIVANDGDIASLDSRLTLVETVCPVCLPDFTDIGSDILFSQDGIFDIGDTAGSRPRNMSMTGDLDVGGLINGVDVGGLATAAADIGSLQVGLATAQGDISSNTAGLGSLGSLATSNASAIASNDTDISNLQSSVATEAARVSTNIINIGNLDTRVLSLESSPPGVNLGNIGESLDFDADDAYDIGTATSRVRDVYVSGDIEIAGFINGVDVSSLSNVVSNVSTLQSELDTAEAGLATAQADVTSLQSGLVTAQSDISLNSAGVLNNLQGVQTNSAGVSGNASGIASNTSNIVANDGDIADLDLRLLALETATPLPVVDLGNIGESLDFDADDAYDIGTATSRVRDVYVSGDLEIEGFVDGVDVGSLSNVTNDLSIIDSDLDAVEIDLATAQNDIASNTAALGSIGSIATGNASAIAGNTSGIASNTSNIVANDGDIAGLDLRLLALETATPLPVVDLGNIGESLDFDADDAYDIGTATSRVRDVYVSGDIEIAGFINGVDVSSLSNVVSNVSTLQSELDTAEAGLATAQADVTNLQSGLVAAQSDISSNTAALGSIGSIATGNASAIASNDADIAANASAIVGNTSGIASNTSNIVANDGDILTLTDNLNSLVANVGDLETDLSGLTGSIAGLSTGITSNSSNIASNTSNIVANDGDIAGLDLRLLALETATPLPVVDLGNIGESLDFDADDAYDIGTATSRVRDVYVSGDVNVQGLVAGVDVGGLATAAADIGSLQTGLVTAQSDIASNTSAISSNTSGLTVAQSDIVGVQSALSSFSLGISTNTTGVASNLAEIQSNDADIASLQSFTTSAFLSDGSVPLFGSLKAGMNDAFDIGTSTENFKDIYLSGDVNVQGLVAGVDVGGLATAAADIGSLQTGLATAQSDVGSLQTGLATAEADIVSNSASIGSFGSIAISNSSSISALDTRVTQNESDIAALQAGGGGGGGGAFATATNVTSNAPGDPANDDFVFGSSQLDEDPGSATDGSRMYFDKSKSAFRAGLLDAGSGSFPGTFLEWDEANVGDYSAAFGRNNTASAIGTFVAGRSNLADGFYGFASGLGVENYADWGFGYGLRIALGSDAATNQSLIGIGRDIDLDGFRSVALGDDLTSSVSDSFLFGKDLEHNTGGASVLIGQGASTTNKMTVGSELGGVIAMGMNSSVPSMVIRAGDGASTPGVVKLNSGLELPDGTVIDDAGDLGGGPVSLANIETTGANDQDVLQYNAGTGAVEFAPITIGSVAIANIDGAGAGASDGDILQYNATAGEFQLAPASVGGALPDDLEVASSLDVGLSNSTNNGSGNFVSGQQNTITNGIYSAIVGGTEHSIDTFGSRAAIIGGRRNRIEESSGVAIGGIDNVVAASSSIAVGGQLSALNGDESTLLSSARLATTVNSNDSIVIGGSDSTANPMVVNEDDIIAMGYGFLPSVIIRKNITGAGNVSFDGDVYLNGPSISGAQAGEFVKIGPNGELVAEAGSGGNFDPSATTSLIPTGNGVQNLGSSTNSWGDLYVQDIILTASSITTADGSVTIDRNGASFSDPNATIASMQLSADKVFAKDLCVESINGTSVGTSTKVTDNTGIGGGVEQVTDSTSGQCNVVQKVCGSVVVVDGGGTESDLLAEINALKAAVATLQSQVAAITALNDPAQVATILADIAQNQADISELNGDVFDNISRLNAQDTAIASNQTDIQANTTSIQANATSIQTNAGDIQQNATNISDNLSGLSSLNVRVTNLESQIP